MFYKYHSSGLDEEENQKTTKESGYASGVRSCRNGWNRD